MHGGIGGALEGTSTAAAPPISTTTVNQVPPTPPRKGHPPGGSGGVSPAVVTASGVSLGPVAGTFYDNPTASGPFDASQLAAPVFSQQFQNLYFDPNPDTLSVACSNSVAVDTNTRPFTDVFQNSDGTCGTVATQGNGQQAGVGSMFDFEAAFTTNMTVAAAGQLTFTMYVDDGWIFGAGQQIGGTAQPTYVSGLLQNPPACSEVKCYPVVGAWNSTSHGGNVTLTVNFPAAGTYPIEFDYTECCGGGETIELMTSNLAPIGPAAASGSDPVKQSYGTCNGAGMHALSASVCTADPVNSLSGAFTNSATDLTLPGVGVPLDFSRSYTSADTTVGRLGPGWTDRYSAALAVQPNGDVLLHGEDGQQVSYTKQADGSFVGAGGAQSLLTSVTGGYQLVRHDQVTYRFDSNGALQSMRDRNGQGLTFAYGSGRLTGATDALGRTMTLAYNANNLVSSVATPDGRTVSYAYTNGSLTSVTLPDPDGPGPLAAPVWKYTYDTAGRLATIVDPDNHTAISNVYDSTTGRVSQQTDANNNTTRFAWDPTTQTATVTDARNDVWKDVYTNSVLSQRIDAASKSTQLGHDAALNTTFVTSPDGTSTTSMTYDTRGNLLTATAPTSLGSVQKSFTYDSQNDVTGITDARGKVTGYGYDAAGNLTSITRTGVTIAQYAYNNIGQLTSSTDGNGKTTAYTYDANGNLASQTDPLGDKTSYSYDAAGHMLTRVDPLGNVSGGNPANYTTTYSYGANGQLLSETDPLGNKTSFTYDEAGNQTSVTDANNNTTVYAYDAANHLTRVAAPDPDGAGPLTAPITTYTYDAAGNRITKVDPRGNVPNGNPAAYTTTFGYDADNRLSSMTLPGGEKTSYGYDANGNRTTVVDPRGNVTGANPADFTTSYAYDAVGRLLSVTDPLGNKTSHSYDPVGNLASVTDANNHTTSYTYDAAGRVLTVTAPDGGVTTYTYDPNGNELSRSDANNHTTSYSYDADSRLVTVTNPSPAPQTTYTYDANGNQTTKVEPKGTTTYTYDHANRLKTIGYSDSTPGVTYGYDAVGNRTSVGGATYAYDALNRLTSVASGTDTFSYAYDAANNITSRTYPDGTLTTYSYDDDNRLTGATSNGNTTSYTYDPASELTKTTLPSGNGYVETRSYDNAGRLTEVKNANASATLSDYAYTFDPVGNPTTVAQSGAVTSTTAYGYDANDRLTSVCFQASCPNGSDPYIRWTYDKVGNRLTEARPNSSTTYGYNAADQLTQTVTQGASQYSSQVIADGAQPYWRFGEAGGSTFASAVGSFTGTWTGSPTLGAAGALNGDTNTSVALNGSSQYGTVANASQLGKTNSFSIELWLKRSKNAASQAVVGKPLTTTTKSENYALWLDTANKVRFEVGSGTKSATTTSATALDTNWHYIVATFSLGTLNLYIDGTLSSTATAAFTSAGTNTGTLDIGRAGTSNYYGGGLDELAIYGTALSAAQVSDHYTKGTNTSQTTAYSYDQNGNETAAGARTFSYDLANRLISTTAGFTTDTYAYDGNGNRNRFSDTNTVTRPVTVTTHTYYLWDEANALPQLALVRDDSGNVIDRYTYGARRIAMNTGGANYYYHYDGLGNVTNVTSATGATEWTYAYEPFGTLRTQTQNDPNAPGNSMLFSGEYQDGTGLYNLRARQYDPTIGRFLTTEPAQRSSTSDGSSYAYAADRPTVFADPSGLTIEPTNAGLSAALNAASPADDVGADAMLAASSLEPPVEPPYGEIAQDVFERLVHCLRHHCVEYYSRNEIAAEFADNAVPEANRSSARSYADSFASDHNIAEMPRNGAFFSRYTSPRWPVKGFFLTRWKVLDPPHAVAALRLPEGNDGTLHQDVWVDSPYHFTVGFFGEIADSSVGATQFLLIFQPHFHWGEPQPNWWR